MSARIASVPPVITPLDAASHPEAGIYGVGRPDAIPVGERR